MTEVDKPTTRTRRRTTVEASEVEQTADSSDAAPPSPPTPTSEPASGRQAVEYIGQTPVSIPGLGLIEPEQVLQVDAGQAAGMLPREDFVLVEDSETN